MHKSGRTVTVVQHWICEGPSDMGHPLKYTVRCVSWKWWTQYEPSLLVSEYGHSWSNIFPVQVKVSQSNYYWSQSTRSKRRLQGTFISFVKEGGLLAKKIEVPWETRPLSRHLQKCCESYSQKCGNCPICLQILEKISGFTSAFRSSWCSKDFSLVLWLTFPEKSSKSIENL